MKRKCDRCGKKYKAVKKQLNYQNITYPCFQGVSERCVERTWEICDKCLGEIVTFMDFPQYFKCDRPIVVK